MDAIERAKRKQMLAAMPRCQACNRRGAYIARGIYLCGHHVRIVEGIFGAVYRMKESTVCQACGQDKGKGCWTRPYNQERVFLCPDCYADNEGRRMPLSRPVICDCGFATMDARFAVQHLKEKHPEVWVAVEEEEND